MNDRPVKVHSVAHEALEVNQPRVTAMTPPNEQSTDETLPCDCCGLPLSRHNKGAGVPMCPIYASYRIRLSERISVLEGALEPFARGPDGTSLAKLYAHLNREHYHAARAALDEERAR